ncbi:E3 ubiquitin-protein ligase CHFR [Ceratocystis platani]|uniref:E3 ubiquitin-protein ligase CHFR n=1 Tax=Ceratocystis fimbriata f. sp. platani TaxID=88771 RepID=A0A0F8D085_CERFI|nr:E3 ubiquitin-protein ligase CHFR [Ceratocystis platani]
MDLEKELTCSICTELLFQPLTLLDCLHTFCGACLKDWFAFQASAAERSPLPLPPAGTPLFTCPACRAAVRDTKHNATVATLLDMFTTAHPERDRSAAEKDELREKYQPSEKVLPDVDLRGRSEQEQVDAEEDRRLMEHAAASSSSY